MVCWPCAGDADMDDVGTALVGIGVGETDVVGTVVVVDGITVGVGVGDAVMDHVGTALVGVGVGETDGVATMVVVDGTAVDGTAVDGTAVDGIAVGVGAGV